MAALASTTLTSTLPEVLVCAVIKHASSKPAHSSRVIMPKTSRRWIVSNVVYKNRYHRCKLAARKKRKRLQRGAVSDTFRDNESRTCPLEPIAAQPRHN